MIYYISDVHLGHENVLKFDKRPFADTEEMWQIMLERWNEKVKAEDDVYILGDVCYHSKYTPEFYLQQLNGKKHLIVGNHDRAVLDSPSAIACFVSIDPILWIKDRERDVVLCHFPMAEWDGMRRKSWHVYGHIHCRRNEVYEFMITRERALNAGCMINNYEPVTFEEMIENNRRFRGETS